MFSSVQEEGPGVGGGGTTAGGDDGGGGGGSGGGELYGAIISNCN